MISKTIKNLEKIIVVHINLLSSSNVKTKSFQRIIKNMKVNNINSMFNKKMNANL